MWLGFAGAWLVFLISAAQLDEASLPGAALLAIWPALWVGWLAGHAAYTDVLLWSLTRRASALALVPAALIGFFAAAVAGGRPSLPALVWGLTWTYVSPLTLGLAGAAWRLGWLGKRLLPVCGLYVLVGAALVCCLIPLSSGRPTVFALLFPAWGLGAPAVVMIVGLQRLLASRQPGAPHPGGPQGAEAGGDAASGPSSVGVSQLQP
jgi:hypothetical protein